MASIVYDGVGGGGNLFEGIKFCFLQRVPSRPRWIELVQANGGEVVRVEKQADIVIADDARKDSPPGSISWKYIEQSVRKGAAQNTDDFRAGPASHIVREPGSKQPTKHGRTPFTVEDDRILVDWVTKAEKAGIPSRGNELYKQLEAKHPHHTFQSWRDRWIKQLSGRPRPEISVDEEVGLPKPIPLVKRTRKAQSVQKPRRVSPSTSPEAQYSVQKTAHHGEENPAMETINDVTHEDPTSSDDTVPNVWIAKSAGGMSFTKEENRNLIDAYDWIIEIDPDREIDAWAAWSIKYPNHTPQEWRNYFVKELAPFVAKRKIEKEKRNSGSQKTTAGFSKTLSNEVPNLPVNDEINLDFAESERATSARPSRTSNIDPVEPVSSDSESVEAGSSDPTMNDESVFREYLIQLAEQLEVQVEFTPSICGMEVPLFRLWQVVRSDEFKGKDEVDGRGLWVEVAKKLNFTPFRQTRAAKELKTCYEEILADLEEELREFIETPDLTDSQEQAETKIQHVDPGAGIETTEINLVSREMDEVGGSEDEYVEPRSSPPLPLHKKRNTRDYVIEMSVDKRRRVDSDENRRREIPSTPEDVINSHRVKQSAQQHRGTQIEATPTKRLKPSPLKNSPILDDDLEQGDSNDFMRKLLNKPALTSPLSKVTIAGEPETQNFEFTKYDDDNDDDDNDNANEDREFTSSPSLKPNGRSRSRERISPEVLQGDSSTQSLTQSEVDRDLYEFTDNCIALGYGDIFVYEALEACSLQTGDAHFVMESLQSGRGIPEGLQGVWTAADDIALENKGGSEYGRIIKKHGRKLISLRRKFLRNREGARRALASKSKER